MILTEFLNLFRQGKVSAHSHMKNLLELAMADGHYDPEEDKFLHKLASKHGVAKKKIDEIRDDPNAVEFVIPETSKEKFQYLFELVNMMVIDNHVADEELHLCEIFAIKFGYDKSKAPELVSAIASNIRNGQPLKETKKRVSWLIN